MDEGYNFWTSANGSSAGDYESYFLRGCGCHSGLLVGTKTSLCCLVKKNKTILNEAILRTGCIIMEKVVNRLVEAEYKGKEVDFYTYGPLDITNSLSARILRKVWKNVDHYRSRLESKIKSRDNHRCRSLSWLAVTLQRRRSIISCGSAMHQSLPCRAYSDIHN